MKTGQLTQIIVTMLTILMCGAVEAWADDVNPSNIIIETPTNGTITSPPSVSGREVSLTVTPASGYYIKASDIIVEPLVGTSHANARRRVPTLADQIVGKMYVGSKEVSVFVGDGSSSATYKFTLPDRYDGAYVTTTFSSQSAGVTWITGSTSSVTYDANGHYILADDVNANVLANIISGSQSAAFTGTFEGQAKADGTFPVISGLTEPLFASTSTNAIIRNVMLYNVQIDKNGNIGAICRVAAGKTRIYNCGILPTSVLREDPKDKDKITGFSGSSVSGTENVGGIAGLLSENARVINCFSYATVSGGSIMGGVVGNIGYAENTSITQDDVNSKPMVVNCMFYGNITGGSNIAPVYGGADGAMIKNDAAKGVNPYCYFRGEASFNTATNFGSIEKYKRSWPAEEEYLTRFEYYRSILNSNRKLCTWWVNGTSGTAPTDANVENVGIAKWVLDPEMAPYPILKKWGRYFSVVNPDPERTWDSEANNGDGGWQVRSIAKPYRGRSFKDKLSVTVRTGSHPDDEGMDGISVIDRSWILTITDIDTLNHDYGYYKVQLPYYNEVFGNPNETNHIKRYYGNYTDKVVTGWKITYVNKTGKNSFNADWESGYNFADRDCTDKDLFDTSGRVFAQGGFYYVPEGVTSITIEAYWGKAVYLANSGRNIDRVNITAQTGDRKVGNAFTPAGTIPSTFQGQTVQTEWHNAVTQLDKATKTDDNLDKTVYDQAIVLLSNFQLKNGNGSVGDPNNWYPYTMMSIDQDLDNEPDYCFDLQFRRNWDRPAIQPIRFDFLPVVELGTAVRHNENGNTIGIFIPQGHFEITETALMRTTQFEYDGANTRVNSPVILNGGNFEQIVVRKGPQNKTTYFLLGGHFRIKRFTPGAHTNRNDNPKIRLCAVNVVGGEFPEFYLSGIYRPDLTPESVAKQGNPHCYTNGGYFGTMAGAGYDKILGDVTFKIDHSIIDEFYGGGINGSKPIGGSIDVTIDHSLVGKYCGGPKVGTMTAGKTVTTHATGTTFAHYYGGGNGGTSYYREQGYDGNDLAIPEPTAAGWTNFCKDKTCAKYDAFNPLNTISSVSPAYDTSTEKKGYHALYEFECFNESNGLGQNPTLRTYTHWAQFGTTSTGNTTNILNDCIIENDFYGGGNLGNVSGWVKSTLTGCTVNGNVFGGGYSGNIEPFRIHDKSSTVFPEIDNAGVMHNGELGFLKNADNTDRYYTWCYENSAGKTFPEGITIPSDAATDQVGKATFSITDAEGKVKWYVLTTVSLEGLGAVSEYTELTLDGSTTVGTLENGKAKVGTGNVYGGGNESAVNGNTTVNLQGNTHVYGNVFGGGNEAEVSGSTTVNIGETPAP